MRINKFCRQTVLIIFLILINSLLFAQNLTIEYLGIISKDIDQNMSKMTSDLYFTQLNEIQNITVLDKRDSIELNDIPEKNILSKSNLSFYTNITKDVDTEIWTSTIFVFNPSTNEQHSKSTDYDSFYKILMESKNTLKESITNLITNTPSQIENDIFNNEITSNKSITSTENISGTWHGEEFIDKIVILRGGRGFVIFNNGASMTISVKLESNDIIITQNGRSNASFYPDLPRQIAMNAALEAEPMEWKLTFLNNDTLVGSKKTIKATSDSFEYSTEKVKWNRVN